MQQPALLAASPDDGEPRDVPGLDTDLEDPDAPDPNEEQPLGDDENAEHEAMARAR